jgi:hypothetical protein
MWLCLIMQVVDGNWGVHAIVPKKVFGLGDLATKEEGETESSTAASTAPAPAPATTTSGAPPPAVMSAVFAGAVAVMVMI